MGQPILNLNHFQTCDGSSKPAHSCVMKFAAKPDLYGKGSPDRKRPDTRLRREFLGFTLIEVVLSLAISIVLMGLLASATQMFLMNLDNERDELERARAARAVLQVMADDFRAAVQYKEIDTTALDEAIASVEAMLPTGEEEEVQEEEEPVVVEQPGLAGGPDSISLDISRLPRRDQYLPSVDPKSGQIISLPSEIRNINYVVGVAEEYGGQDPVNATRRVGLLRMEFDRAAKRYADEGGGAMPGYEMLAEEVKQLGFRYFDGESWADTWDTNEMRTLPVAIEITLLVDTRTAEFRAQQAQAGDRDAAFGLQQYVTTVHLPLAESVAAIQAREELKNYVE